MAIKDGLGHTLRSKSYGSIGVEMRSGPFKAKSLYEPSPLEASKSESESWKRASFPNDVLLVKDLRLPFHQTRKEESIELFA